MLESYARGVNAFIATGHRPVEYQLLDAEPATMAALALDRGDAADRLSDGLGLVEAVARRGACRSSASKA